MKLAPKALHFRYLLVGLIAAVVIFRLFDGAWRESWDFFVYWKAAQSWVQYGKSPFEFSSADKGFVFKYPPWVLPLFFPFGFLSLSVSKLLWAVLELGCVGYIVRWVLDRGVSRVAAGVTWVIFWRVWREHFDAGQLALPMLAAALAWERNRESLLGSAGMVILFSSKVFSSNTLLGAWRELLRPKVIGVTLCLSFVGFFWVWGGLMLHGNTLSPEQLLGAWLHAATSGGAELGEATVRGIRNKGFTAALLRAFHVGPKLAHADALIWAILTLVLASGWSVVARSLEFCEQWAGWLALGVVVHPLAWDHSYVLAYPLCAFAFHWALRSRNRWWIGCSVLGMCCIGVLISGILMDEWLLPFETFAGKSWGVCLSAAALLGAKKVIPHGSSV
jgi:hypothetical protein